MTFDARQGDRTWRTLADHLAEEISTGKITVGSRLPTGDSLAQELGVGRNTVHRAVEELQRRGLVVRRPGVGSVVISRYERKLKVFGLLIDGFAPSAGYPKPELLQGIQARLGNDARLIVSESKFRSDIEVRELLALEPECEGLIMIPTAQPDSTETIRRVVSQGMPVVVIDRYPADIQLDAVFTDNKLAMSQAVELLHQTGHTRIGYMSFYRANFQAVFERYDGYREALERLGTDPAQQWVRWLPVGSDENWNLFLQMVSDMVYTLTHGPAPISAICCCEDQVCRVVIEACQNLQIDFPRALEIVSFSDWSLETVRRPSSFHRIVQNQKEIGFAAADLLMRRIDSPLAPLATLRVPADLYPC